MEGEVVLCSPLADLPVHLSIKPFPEGLVPMQISRTSLGETSEGVVAVVGVPRGSVSAATAIGITTDAKSHLN